MRDIKKAMVRDQKRQMTLLSDLASAFIEKDGKRILKINPTEAYHGDPIKGEYDLALCNLGLGLRRKTLTKSDEGINIKGLENWIKLFEILQKLSPNGCAFAILEPMFWTSISGKKFQEELNKAGFYVNALFQIQTGFLETIAIRPYIAFIERRKQNEKIFVAELEEGFNLSKISYNYKNSISGNIYKGLFIKESKFKGFERYKAEKESEILSKQYKKYKKVCVKDLVKKHKTKDFEEDSESIYLRMAGNFKAVEFSEITKKKYLQLKLDVKKVNPVYLKTFFNSDVGNKFLNSLDVKKVNPVYLTTFFNSDVGNKFLNSLGNGLNISYLQIDEFLESEIYLLPLDLQNKTVEIMSKINSLSLKINNFKKNVILDPDSTSQTMIELNKLIESLETQNEEERLLSLIRGGETKHVEFKKTLSKNINTKQKDKEMERAVLKTICGFLNTDGGTLFVGVEDSGDIYGVDKDLYPNNDNYLLHFKNLLKDQIGVKFLPLINYEIKKLLEKDVLVVECKQSNTEVWLGKEEAFYVRSNPSTDELKGKELIEYIKNHFKKE